MSEEFNNLEFILKESNTNINNENLTNFMKNKKCIIRVYSDTCPHCVDLIPIWNEYLKRMKQSKKNKDLNVISIESASLRNINNNNISNNVIGVPTILYVSNTGDKEIVSRFENERTPEKLMEWTFKNLKNSINLHKKRLGKKTSKRKHKKSKKSKKINKSLRNTIKNLTKKRKGRRHKIRIGSPIIY